MSFADELIDEIYKVEEEYKALEKKLEISLVALRKIRGDGPLLADEETIDDSEELAAEYVIAQEIAEKALTKIGGGE